MFGRTAPYLPVLLLACWVGPAVPEDVRNVNLSKFTEMVCSEPLQTCGKPTEGNCRAWARSAYVACDAEIGDLLTIANIVLSDKSNDGRLLLLARNLEAALWNQ